LANEASLVGKSLQLLKELAPQTVRAIAVFNPATTPGQASPYVQSFNEAARAIGLEPIAAPIETSADIDAVFEKVTSGPQAGGVLLPSPFLFTHRAEIASAAIRNQLPVVGAYPDMVSAGGLASYGTNQELGYRVVAGYVDRILRGEKPADLPVQTPTSFELIINVNTARALGLEISPMLLNRADRVIE
jgi:putative ABC transport system substrate-binding protein